MGEGAGIVVLETREHAARRNARVHALFAGAGMSCDAYHMTAPDPEGKGAMLSMKLALERLENEFKGNKDVEHLARFVKGSERGIIRKDTEE